MISFREMNTFVSAFVVRRRYSVAAVVARRRWPQIVPPVVRFVCVLVINFFSWPFSGHVEHRETMLQIELPVDPYSSIGAWRGRASAIATQSPRTCGHKPYKPAGLWIVTQELF